MGRCWNCITRDCDLPTSLELELKKLNLLSHCEILLLKRLHLPLVLRMLTTLARIRSCDIYIDNWTASATCSIMLRWWVTCLTPFDVCNSSSILFDLLHIASACVRHWLALEIRLACVGFDHARAIAIHSGCLILLQPLSTLPKQYLTGWSLLRLTSLLQWVNNLIPHGSVS